MRVITGSARGRRLETLSGDDVRPTTDRVKEAIFSILQFDIENRSFLDLFAGSGQMGIEALSRGAKSATFVDNKKEAIRIIKDNLNTTKLFDKATVVNMDSLGFLQYTDKKFDYAFIDPPYNSGLLQKAMENIAQVMNESGAVICEIPTNDEILSNYGDFFLDRKYRYGKIMVYVYRHKTILENR